MSVPSLNRFKDVATWVLLFLGAAVFLYPFVRILWRVGDEGTLVYGAQRMVEGALPYRDFFEVMGPGSFYWLGLFFKLGGCQWVVARGVLLGTGVATALLMYWLTRRLDHSHAVLPALFYLIISIPIWPGTNHHWDSNLFALLTVVAFCLWQDRGGGKFLLLAGIGAGITSCFIQQKGVILFGGLLLVVFLSDYQSKENKRAVFSHLGLLTGGYAGLGSLVLLYFYWQGGLNDLLYANLFWPLANYHKVNIVPYGYLLFEIIEPHLAEMSSILLSPPWSEVMLAVMMIPFFLVVILPAVFVLMVGCCLLSKENRPKIVSPARLSYIILGLALFFSELHRKDMPHLIYGIPLLLIISFDLLRNCLSKRRLLYGLTTGILCLGFFSFAAFYTFLATAAQQSMATRRGNIKCFQEDAALKFLLQNTKPGDPVFVYPYYPMYYFLADVRNPTRYSIMMYHTNTEEQFREVIRDLEQAKVKYILWDAFVSGSNLSLWFPQYRHPPADRLILEKYFKEHYDVIAEKNNFKILRRRKN